MFKNNFFFVVLELGAPQLQEYPIYFEMRWPVRILAILGKFNALALSDSALPKNG
jgi:hypothetical protein